VSAARRQVAADLWTKPIGLNHKPACRLPKGFPSGLRWGFPSPDPFSVFLASSDDITSVYKLLPVQFAWKFFFVIALVVAACVTCCVTDVLVKFPLHSLFSFHLSPVAKQLPLLQPNTIMLYRIEIISRTERQSALMSKITNDCLTRSGTWQQWASKG